MDNVLLLYCTNVLLISTDIMPIFYTIAVYYSYLCKSKINFDNIISGQFGSNLEQE
jgi:hypothetical protein